MGKLTTKKRKEMPKSDFAGPNRSYPIKGTGTVTSDRTHAGNAKARASQQVKAGKMSEAEEAKIDRAANKVLKKK